ncbi:MAG: hypothetical protein ACR2FS_09265 [Phormidesmis sp.]
MANRIAKFKDWLLERRAFRVKRFAKDPQYKPQPEEALSQMPDELAEALTAAVEALPTPPREQAAVLDALDEAISQWQDRPRTSANSMVILSTPVTSVSRILVDTLGNRDVHDELLPVNLLGWVERPPEAKSIEQQLREELGWSDAEASEGDSASDRVSQTSDRLEQRDGKNLAVIPNLGWCFLRSAEGLNGVDYLRDTLLEDRSQFWVIGSGMVSWEYLKSTLKFHAYCGETVILPKLTGQELQNWLRPIVEQFDIHFSDAALHKRLKHPDSLLEIDVSADKPIEAISEISQEVSATLQSSVRAIKDEFTPEDVHEEADESPERDYFERLADISDGVSVVAVQLFIKSLRCKEGAELEQQADESVEAEAIETEKQAGKETPEKDKPQGDRQMVAGIPKLPPLPELDQSDMYLLYSLMLHGDLTIRAMAESLGDAPQIVNNQVQVLRKTGVIEQKGKVIKANPVHYPKLRRELAKNNFIIEMP